MSTLSFGILDVVHNQSLFIFISFLSRFTHGIGCSISATLSRFYIYFNINVLVYSSAASICDPENLTVTLGYMEIAWCKII